MIKMSMKWKFQLIFFNVIVNVNDVNAMRPFELVEDPVPTEAPSAGPCGEPCARSEAPYSRQSGFQLQGRGHSLETCRVMDDVCGRDLGQVLVTPWLNDTDPMSSIYELHVDPSLIRGLQRKGENAYLCCDEKKCLCQFEIPPLQLNVLELLQRPLLSLGTKMTETWAQSFLTLEDTCHPRFVLDTLVLLMIAVVSLLGVVMIYTCIVLSRGFKADSSELSRLLTLQRAKSDEALMIPSVFSDLKVGTLQILKLVSLMVSLQAVALEHIKKEAPDVAVCFAVLWPLIFGFVGIHRILRSTCQTQITHAALAQGFCLEAPPVTMFADVFTGAGTVVLALCVATALMKVGCYKLMLLICGLFLGPTLSMLGEIQKARAQDTAMANLEGNHRLRPLMRLFHSDKDPGDRNTADQQISTGNFPIVPFSRIIVAGRAGRAVSFDDLNASPAPHAESGLSLNLWRDLPWHGLVLFKMNGSRAGFLPLLVLVLAMVALLGASMGQAATYLCTAPELSSLALMTSEASLDFKSWIHNYDVKVDRSFKEVYMMASAKSSNTKALSIDSNRSSDDETGATRAVPLSGPLPRRSVIQVQGLRQKNDTYQVQFSPRATLPISLKLVSGNFQRCVPWSELPGALITVPPNTTSIDLEVALAAYEFGIPRGCNDLGHESTVPFTSFCTFDDVKKKRSGEDCTDACRHHANCLAAFPSKLGCFFAESPHREHQTFDCDTHIQFQHRLTGKVSGDLCFAAGPDWTCNETQVIENRLDAKTVTPQWLNQVADLKLDLGLAVGDRKVNSESERLKLLRGPPDLLDVLVNVTGHAKNGSRAFVGASAIVSDGDIVVTLEKYLPFQMEYLELHVAAFLPDNLFEVVWGPNWNVTDVNFSECSKSAFLVGRFRLCRTDGRGWPVQTSKIRLDTWLPDVLNDAFFEIKPKKQDSGLTSSILREVHILLQNASDAAEWAIPGDPSNPCITGFDTPGGLEKDEQLTAFLTSDKVRTEYMRRNCSDIESNVSGTMQKSDLVGLALTHFGSRLRAGTIGFPELLPFIAKLLLSAVDFQMVWVQNLTWQKCDQEFYDILKMSPSSSLCAENSKPPPFPLDIGTLLSRLGSNPSEARRDFARTFCRQVFSRDDGEESRHRREVVVREMIDMVFDPDDPDLFFVVSNLSECWGGEVRLDDSPSQIVFERATKKGLHLDFWRRALEDPHIADTTLAVVPVAVLQQLQKSSTLEIHARWVDWRCRGCGRSEWPWEWEAVVQVLAKTSLPQLESVSVGNEVDQRAVAQVLLSMNTPKLRSVKFFSLDISNVNLGQGQFLTQKPIEELAFDKVEDVDSALKKMSSSLESATQLKLKSLQFHESTMNSEGIEALCTLLGHTQELETLEIWKGLSHNQVVRFSEAMPELSQLKRLVFANVIHGAGREVVGGILSKTPKLESIDLSHNTFTDDLGELLPLQKVPLKSLRLSDAKIGVEGARALSTILRHVSNVESVSLNGNPLKDEGVKEIVEALKNKATHLKQLDLSKTQMGMEGVEVVSTLLCQSPHLQGFHIDGNDPPTDSSTEMFSQALSKCKQPPPLESLDVDCCIEEPTVHHLLQSLRNYTNLTRISMTKFERGPWTDNMPSDFRGVVKGAVGQNWPNRTLFLTCFRKKNGKHGGCDYHKVNRMVPE